MQEYELTVLYNKDIAHDYRMLFEDVLKEVCDLKKVEDDGEKPLAYKINGEDHARYVMYTLALKPGQPSIIEKLCLVNKDILRYLLTREPLGLDLRVIEENIERALMGYNAVRDDQMDDVPYTVWDFKLRGKEYQVVLQEKVD